ncbi:endomucin isoform X4 [Petaurus breviceps papuanus]|uniref:endomucin isoform X4 n=1 Tax=Petaurus breviceps papuanus TaxID=3040969 RepID=UPI0036DD8B90
MKLLQRTFLFLSMFSLCYSQENQDPVTTMTTTKQSTPIVTTSSSPSLSTAISVTVQTSVNTPEKLETTVATEKVTSSIRISSSSLTLSTSNGTLEEQSTMPMISTKSSLSSAVAKTEKETPRSESPSNVSSTTNPPGSDQFRSTMSTTQSIQKSNHILTSPTKKSASTFRTTSNNGGDDGRWEGKGKAFIYHLLCARHYSILFYVVIPMLYP